MKWIYILWVCAGFDTCLKEDAKETRSPESYASLGECHTYSFVAEKVLKAHGRQVVDNDCRRVKEPGHK